MTTDLWLLVGTALLDFAILSPYSFGDFATPDAPPGVAYPRRLP